MRLWVLAFLIGDASLLLFFALPTVLWAWILLLFGLLLWVGLPKKYLFWLQLPIGFFLGLGWGLLNANYWLATVLPTVLESKTLLVTGMIATIPEYHDKSVEFEFLAQEFKDEQVTLHQPLRIRLGWHLNAPQLRVGDTWQLVVRLKRPRGFWNPGSFDYQKWLFEHHIRATGYVVDKPGNRFLESHFANRLADRLRAHLAEGVAQVLKDRPLIGLVNALVVGVRHEITADQWRVMRGTGTNHLFAIAGLHIGFISGMVYGLISFLWRRLGQLSLYVPTPQVAALSALLTTIFYSALAGFALPTQRAMIMTAVFLLATLLRKTLPAWHAWSAALLLVLLWEPLSILSDSFWLSFGAVAFIIYGGSGRVKQAGLWWKWGRIQWVIAFGLIPFTLLFFHQTSLAGFVANAIAIPWIGFVVLPLCLLGSLFLLCIPSLGSWLLVISEYALELIWPVLGWFADLDWAQWYVYIIKPWILISALVGMLLLLAPRGMPGRWLGMIGLLPLLVWKPAGPPIGEFWLSLLDVGQGLSVVIRTHNHVLVYDTGPSFGPTFDTGNAVLVPFLKYSGINQVDRLMVSHPDNDHIGGANSLMEQMKVKDVITSVPAKIKKMTASLCVAGQAWDWDGIHFSVIYPPLGLNDLDNDSSCVLRVDNGQHSVLLLGDIEKGGESYLVNQLAHLLPSEIIVVPHHGSITSSTIAFIEAVRPQIALFSVGYKNKFHFPNPLVVQRYQQIGAKNYNTVDEGAITLKLTQQSRLFWLETYREEFLRFWQR